MAGVETTDQTRSPDSNITITGTSLVNIEHEHSTEPMGGTDPRCAQSVLIDGR